MVAPSAPTLLRVGKFADVVVASADLVLSACGTGPTTISAWTAERGAFEIDPGIDRRTAPQSFAVLSNGRFVMVWGPAKEKDHDAVASKANVFGRDGRPLGRGVVAGAGETYFTCAASPDGRLLAIADVLGGGWVWDIDDLIAGKRPLWTFDEWASALAFTQDSASLLTLVDGELNVHPARGGKLKTVRVEGLTSALQLSTARSGLVCASDGSSAAVVRLDGKVVFALPEGGPNYVQHAAIDPAGDVVVAAAGAPDDESEDVTPRYPADGMEQGHVSFYDGKGRFLSFVRRVKNKRVCALAIGPVIAVGQAGFVELVAQPSPGTKQTSRVAKQASPAVKATAAKRAAPPSASIPVKRQRELLASIEIKASAANVTLANGASDRAIAAAEKALGQPLPDDVKAFYRAHDGAKTKPAVAARELLSLKGVVAQWKIWKQLHDGELADVSDEAEAERGVQPRWWIPAWIPITYDGAGNHHVVDLAPAKYGVSGQILSFWHEDSPRQVVGKSLLQWLAEAPWGDRPTERRPRRRRRTP